jgi:hypothetical protein
MLYGVQNFELILEVKKRSVYVGQKKGAKPILYHRYKFCLWIMIFL